MKVHVARVSRHYTDVDVDDFLFANEKDAVRFAELRDDAYGEGYTPVHEMEVFGSLAGALDSGEGAAFCEMYLDDERQLPPELKAYDLEETE